MAVVESTMIDWIKRIVSKRQVCSSDPAAKAIVATLSAKVDALEKALASERRHLIGAKKALACVTVDKVALEAECRRVVHELYVAHPDVMSPMAMIINADVIKAKKD